MKYDEDNILQKLQGKFQPLFERFRDMISRQGGNVGYSNTHANTAPV